MLAVRLSQQIGSRVTVNNLMRAMILILMDGKERLYDLAGELQIRRPTNNNPAALDRFERALADTVRRTVRPY